MSYPQPKASREVIEGEEIFRLFTELESPGDVYEIDVSANAFAIGPESDLSQARVTYFDPSSPSRSSSVIVSIDSPFIGRIASTKQEFPSGNPGHILVTPVDLFSVVNPSSFGDQLTYIPPRLDLIGYLASPPETPNRRSPRSIYANVVFDGTGDGNARYMVPFFGRERADMNIYNNMAPVGSTGLTVTVLGVAFSYLNVGTAAMKSLGSVNLGSSPSDNNLVVDVASDGRWDYLLYEFASTLASPTVPGTSGGNFATFELKLSDKE